ncbi:hypothetical protein [Prevotella sp. 10(H)]|uniref:hypothetical protein n=1 Tax=Prevotella sp. 10(H) TaxID=1158294 RepID=UPI0012DCD595|nr:hypothetical protein [Prevotella sp. 10(H)]
MKRRRNFMRPCVIFLLLFLILATTAPAQVTIGSGKEPEKAAVLDIKTKEAADGKISSTSGGILFPRVVIKDEKNLNAFTDWQDADLISDEQHKRHIGLTVYNIGDVLDEGLYTWDGEKWQKSGCCEGTTPPSQSKINFFYMPSIAIDLDQAPPAGGIDLYQRYASQFMSPKAGNDLGTPMPIIDKADLKFYVTDYDSEIFSNVQLNSSGMMTYTLKSNLPTNVSNSYINIVFVVNEATIPPADLSKLNFFYMPSIKIDLTQAPPTNGIDLYDKYFAQFDNPKAFSSPDPMPTIEKGNINFYVTDYDEDIFASVQLTTDKKLKYTLKSGLSADSFCSYINIVLVVK